MRAFYAVVEEGNISHAALQLGVAQSALSRQMKRLEEFLGVRLFERGSRLIRLTEAGRDFYSRVENILGLFDHAVAETREIGEGAAGSVRLGTITTSGVMILPRLMAEFHQKYPNVQFELWEADGGRIMELLDNRVIEIAITRTQVDNEFYDSFVLPNEPLTIVMRSDDRLTENNDETLPLEKLKDVPLIIPLRWQNTLKEICKKIGFTPNIVCVSRTSAMDLLFVKRGLGAAILPASATAEFSDGSLVAKKLVEPQISTHTVIAWLKNQPLSGSSRNLLNFFREMFLST